MQYFNIFVMSFVALSLGGCLSAGVNSKLCSDLKVVSKVVGAVSENAGKALSEYTPKKCINAGVNGDSGNLTGGVSVGVTNE